MSTASPQPDAASRPPDGAPKKRRNAWLWVSAGLGLVVVALAVWGFSARSDLDSTQDELSGANQELASTQKELEVAQQELGSECGLARALPHFFRCCA